MDKKQKGKTLEIALGKKNLYIGFDKIRNEWSEECIEDAVKLIVGLNTKSSKLFLENLLPNEYERLCKGRIFSYRPQEIERELNWYVAIINCFSEKINDFLVMREQFENNFILGEYSKADKLINNIDKKICASIWGLDNRFVLYEYMGGLEKNKEWLAQISSIECDSWVGIYADLFSFKAEKGVNNRQYLHRIDRLFTGVQDGIKSYFEEKLYPVYTWDVNNIYDLLYYNECSSIIDIYLIFVEVCAAIASNEKIDDHLKAIVYRSIGRVHNIDDLVIEKIKFKLDKSTELVLSDFDLKMYEIGNMYTEGKYAEVIHQCCELLEEKANCFELYEYFVKSHVMSNQEVKVIKENTVLQELIQYMYCAYLKNQDVSKSYLGICRIERLLVNSNFGNEIAAFFVDKYMIGHSEVQSNMKELTSRFINIKMVQMFNETRKDIFDYFEKLYGKGSSLIVFKMQIDKQIGDEKLVEKNRYRWYSIKTGKNIETKVENLEQWYSEIDHVQGSFCMYQKERISTELFYLYLEEKKILAAEQLYVKNRLDNRFSVLRMDMQELFEQMAINVNKVKDSLCTPIIAFLYDESDYATIYAHVANFLESNNLLKPSDIFSVYQNYQLDELIFFMKNICVDEILDSMYFAFESEDDVEAERINICQFLQKIDSKNENDYITEISHILKNKQIMQSVKYIENVKLDVDMNKIIEQHLNTFEDNFKRFRQIGELDIEYEAIDLTNNLIYIKSNTDSRKYNHKLIVFKEILIDFRNELAFGKYGLDQMIGTRIRHGSMQNQLRVVFEKNNIIFVKNSTKENDYIPSVEFEKQCNNLTGIGREKVFTYFSGFSREIDDYFEMLRSQYVKIKTEEVNPHGIIDLNINVDELVKLFEQTQRIKNENIVLEMFEDFWLEKLNESLENARKFFNGTVKDKIIGMLNELEENIRNVIENEQIQFNLFDAISRGRTEIQNAITNVSEWFQLPTKQEYAEFDSTRLIETCEGINRRVFTNYNQIHLNKKINSQSKINGNWFSYFIDIMIILFTNAYYHSGYLNNLSELNVDLNIDEQNEKLIIFIRNNLSGNINITELQNTILRIQEKINTSIETGQYSNFEGGSGYVKICKILEWNIGTKWYLEFGLEENDEYFFTKIVMDINKIIY